MNKRAQYYEKPSYGNVHPVLIIGIMIIVFRYMTPIFGWIISPSLGSIFSWIGIITILIGGLLSILKANS